MDLSEIPHLPDAMPTFPDANALMTELSERIDSLKALNFDYELTGGGGGLTGTSIDEHINRIPSWLTYDILISFINNTPNAKEASREQYVAFMEAVIACRSGLIVKYGPSPEQDRQLADAMASWATKWPGNVTPAAVYEAEYAKVEQDWFSEQRRIDLKGASWHSFLTTCEKLGWTDAYPPRHGMTRRNSRSITLLVLALTLVRGMVLVPGMVPGMVLVRTLVLVLARTVLVLALIALVPVVLVLDEDGTDDNLLAVDGTSPRKPRGFPRNTWPWPSPGGSETGCAGSMPGASGGSMTGRFGGKTSSGKPSRPRARSAGYASDDLRWKEARVN